MEAPLDEIVDMIDNAPLLVKAGEHYSAAKMLDGASKAFEDLVENVEENSD